MHLPSLHARAMECATAALLNAYTKAVSRQPVNKTSILIDLDYKYLSAHLYTCLHNFAKYIFSFLPVAHRTIPSVVFELVLTFTDCKSHRFRHCREKTRIFTAQAALLFSQRKVYVVGGGGRGQNCVLMTPVHVCHLVQWDRLWWIACTVPVSKKTMQNVIYYYM